MAEEDRDPKVSQAYRALEREEPPRALDEAILAAARRAVGARPAPLVATSAKRRRNRGIGAVPRSIGRQSGHSAPEIEIRAAARALLRRMAEIAARNVLALRPRRPTSTLRSTLPGAHSPIEVSR